MCEEEEVLHDLEEALRVAGVLVDEAMWRRYEAECALLDAYGIEPYRGEVADGRRAS